MADLIEMIDIYNDDREFTGLTLSRKEKLSNGQYMLYVLALIENKEGKFLITQRALDKKWAAGQWEIPGGGALAGEDSMKAICREVFEETGLTINPSDAEIIYSYKNIDEKYGDNYFADIFLVKMDFTLDDIKLETRESTNVTLANVEEIKAIYEKDGFLHYKRICEALKIN